MRKPVRMRWYTLFLLFISSFLWACDKEEPPADTANSDFTLAMDTLVTGLGIPWGLAQLPNNDLLITIKQGRLYRYSNGNTQEIQGLPDIYVKGQGGLLDVQLDPDYEDNGWLYLAYAAPGAGGGNTAILRAKLSGNTLIDQEKIFQGQPYLSTPYHYGSRIAFDGDGHLYFSIGDRGTMENAQDLTNHCGKIHRINKDGSIPSDNPFVDSAGAMASIFSYGHRNPQGVTTHPATGAIWTHEHGPKGGDEINIVAAGLNYGWPEITHGIDYDGSIITTDTAKPGMEQPLHYWVPSIAPCGMDFVTSANYPGWAGDLLIGSLKFGYLHRCDIEDGKVVGEEKLLEGVGRVRDVLQGRDGYLYISVDNGWVIKLLPE